jgi:hypothetical protein
MISGGAGAGQGANYRYVITVDRNDEPGTRLLTQGHRWRGDAQLAYSFHISDARKKFRMPNDVLSRLDTRSDRRAGVLHAVKVGPETITLRRRKPSDVNITAPPPKWVRAKSSEPWSTRIGNAIVACLIWLACVAVIVSIEVFVLGGVIVDDGSRFGRLMPWKMITGLFGG